MSGRQGNERGYALIGAMWLLLLAASLAGILMLRAVTGSREAAAHAIGSREIAIEASREADLVDINAAPIEVIEQVLRTDATTASDTAALISAIRTRRAQNRPFTSSRELANAKIAGGSCRETMMTVHGGQTTMAPVTSSFDAVVGTVSPSAIRLRVSGSGAQRMMIFRPGLPGQAPLLVLEAGKMGNC